MKEIEGKQATVQSYTCTLISTGLMDLPMPAPEFETRATISFKRPHFYAITEVHAKHPSPKLAELTATTVIDGQMWWELRQPAPGSGKRVLERMGKTPTEKDADFIARHDAASVLQRNFPVLQRAGATDDVLAEEMKSPLAPFALCDKSTLKLESQDDNLWVFTARARTSLENVPESLRLNVSKADGMLRALRADSTDGKSNLSIVVEEIQINPQLADTVFQFTPPPGVAVTEISEDEAERFHNRNPN